jgi:prepilin-type N-terminal cleavage/methylation domain-containing protein
MSPRNSRRRAERGMTLVEVLIAILVLTTGILAVGRLIPAATRGQLSDEMLTQGNAYAQQKVEAIQSLTWSDPLLADGRHPGGTATEPLGSNGQWQRYYEVATLAAPLDNLRKITVTVNWNFSGPHSVTATTYVRR